MVLEVISLGAGVQSTCMYLMSDEGALPKADVAIFADTGWEHPQVYEHLDALERWSQERAGIPIVRASRGNLRDDVLDPRVFATIPAWTKEGAFVSVPVEFSTCPTCSGFRLLSDAEDTCEDCKGEGVIPVRWEERPSKAKLGRIVRQCTPKYKVQPLERELRRMLGAPVWDEPCRYCGGTGERVPPWLAAKTPARCSVCQGTRVRHRIGAVPKGARANQWIGFSFDELERATTLGFPAYSTPVWPLLELRMKRSGCVAWMAERGWKGVAKSACLGCPFHDDDTWLEMADRDPELFADLVQYDRAIRHGGGLRAERFLHESCLPLDEAIDKYRQYKTSTGIITLLPEWAPKRKIRHCNPFSCRSEDLDDEIGSVVAMIAG